jgi:hypothetical protein
MPFCVVLLKGKLRVLSYNLVYNWDNNARIRAFIYCLLVLLPKEPLMPAVFPTYRPPKHLSNLPLVAVLYVVLVVNLLSPNYPCNPDLCVSPRLCPRLVTLEDLIPLFVRPIDVLFSPFKSLLPILFGKRALLP